MGVYSFETPEVSFPATLFRPDIGGMVKTVAVVGQWLGQNAFTFLQG